MKTSNSTIVLFLLTVMILPVLAAQGAQTGQASSSEQEIQLPESYVERMRTQGTVLELSLKEAIRLALNNNLEIAIENFNEDLTREQVIKTRGFYDPTLTLTVGWNSRQTPVTSRLDAGGGIQVSESSSFAYNTQLRQNVLGGGALQLTFNNSRSDTLSTFFFVNPRFNTNLDFQFIQPLLRGFRQTSTERQIKVANLDTRISDTQFKQRVSEIVQELQNQYWELVYSLENYETQRKSVELAVIQYRNNRKRVEIGVMAPIEITSSQAEVARREQALIQSEVQIINAQNALKRLLAPDPEASIWNLTLIPLDRPEEREVTIAMDAAIDRALANRPELERIRLQQEQNEINQVFYKREGKPQVNLRGSFGSVGTSGRVVEQVTQGFDPVTGLPIVVGENELIDHPLFGNFADTAGQVFGLDYTNWGVFVDVEIPLRNRSNDADMAMTRIRQRQLDSTVKNQQQAIIVEVRNALETITTRKKSLDAARVARQLAQEQLDGENKRFEAGLSTNFEVLRFQRDLAENQVAELRAIVDYQLALVALEKAMYTIIEDADISVARGR